MSCGNPLIGIELFRIRLCGIEFPNKDVAMVAYFGTDLVEERVSNQPLKTVEGRPTHTPGITLPRGNYRTLKLCIKEGNALPGRDSFRICQDFSNHGGIVHRN